MRGSLPAVQSFTGGYADTSGYLALKGLFTSHVTGNFVTLGSALVFGNGGALTKSLALPTFCGAVVLIRLIATRLRAAGRPVLRTVLGLQLMFLVAAAALAAWAGPISDPDTGSGMAIGLTLVAAMALQNAAHRVHLSYAPPSTVMTGTTTQFMLDLTDYAQGLAPEKAATVLPRMKAMAISIALFAGGCGFAALLFAAIGNWCFCVLPVLGALAMSFKSEIVDARV